MASLDGEIAASSGCLLDAQKEALENWRRTCSKPETWSSSCGQLPQKLVQNGLSALESHGYTVGGDSSPGWFQRALTFAVCVCYEMAASKSNVWSLLLTSIKLRVGKATDAPALLGLIRELAEFEKEPDAVVIDEATLLRDGFPEDGSPLFHVLVLEDTSGKMVGFALCYISYSTWTGRNLYLEDLYITPSARRGGLGTLAIDVLTLAAACSRCSRVSWQALDWNEPAVKCYEKLGAHNESQWLNFKLHSDDIQRRVDGLLA